MDQVSEAISLINSLMISSTPSSSLITESLELKQLETGVDNYVLEEDFYNAEFLLLRAG